MEVILDSLSEEYFSLIREWKANESLCSLIMSRPVLLDNDGVRTWVASNSNDINQVFRGIFVKNQESIVLVGIARLMYIDQHNRNAEIGLFVGSSEYRGQGIGKQAIIQMLDVAFNQNHLVKVYARIRITNLSSINAFESIGFIREGTLRDAYRCILTGFYEDVAFYSIFNHSWQGF